VFSAHSDFTIDKGLECESARCGAHPQDSQVRNNLFTIENSAEILHRYCDARDGAYDLNAKAQAAPEGMFSLFGPAKAA